MKKQHIPVRIRGMVATPTGYGVLVSHELKTSLVFVDSAVGQALTLALKGVRLPRPLTHDLFINVFAGLEVRLLKVVVHDLREGVFYARMFLEQQTAQGSSYLEIDARPSDAMTLAIKMKAPLYVAAKVWQEMNDVSEMLKDLESSMDSDLDSEALDGIDDIPSGD